MPLIALLDAASLVMGFPMATMIEIDADVTYGILQNILLRGRVNVRENHEAVFEAKSFGYVSAFHSFEEVTLSPKELPSPLRRIYVGEGLHVHLHQVYVDLRKDPFLFQRYTEAVGFLCQTIRPPKPEMLPSWTVVEHIIFDLGLRVKKLPVDALFGLTPEDKQVRFEHLGEK